MADIPDLSTPLVRVTMSDGATHEVQTANPDLVRFDMTRGRMHWPALQDAAFLWLTFIAWAALKREHEIPDDMTWETFSETECLAVEVLNVTVPPGEVGPASPTLPGLAPGSLSS
jgi:hypothetical protein